ncbi:stefin-C-like [Glandiceps talaboti]
MASIPGGWSKPQSPTPEIYIIAGQVKSFVDSSIDKIQTVYMPTEFISQVVAGMNYKIKIKVDNDKYVHVDVFQSLDGKVEPKRVTPGKTASDPLSPT